MRIAILTKIIKLKFLVLILILMPAGLLAEGDPHESKLKAAYIFTFAKFSDWSNTKGLEKGVSDEGVTLNVCSTLGADMGEALNEIKGQKVGDIAIAVTHIGKGIDPGFCHIFYIDHASEDYWLNELQGRHGILTVGESDKFLKKGGIIQFYLKRGKLRFSIHLSHLRQAQVSIEGRMLRLAKTVGR